MGHSKTDTTRHQKVRASAKLCRPTGHDHRQSGLSALFSPTPRGITGRSAYGPKCRCRHFGPAFIKVCSYFPYPAKIWVNGHEWAKRQAAKAGIAFTELSNGFAACDDPASLQVICDAQQPQGVGLFPGGDDVDVPLRDVTVQRPGTAGHDRP